MNQRIITALLLTVTILCRSLSLFGEEKWTPDFIIVGAQKAATGSLREMIIQHPNIVFSYKREVHFFDFRFSKGHTWYRKQFPKRPSKEYLIGEKTPYYLFHPLVPKRVFSLCPNVKIIAILRNPVNRAYSHYHFNVRNGDEKLTFEEALKAESARLQGEEEKLRRSPKYAAKNFRLYSYKKRGEYAEQLKRWLKYFPSEQILVLTTDELSKNTLETMNRVFRFLNLSELEQLTIAKEVSNYPPMHPKTRKKLVEYFRPHNQRLMKMLGRQLDWDK